MAAEFPPMPKGQTFAPSPEDLPGLMRAVLLELQAIRALLDERIPSDLR